MMGVNLFRIAPHSTQAQAFATSSWTLNLGIDICAIVGGTMLDDLAPRRFGRPFLLKGCGLAR